jgi:hypothetical protein
MPSEERNKVEECCANCQIDKDANELFKKHDLENYSIAIAMNCMLCKHRMPATDNNFKPREK